MATRAEGKDKIPILFDHGGSGRTGQSRLKRPFPGFLVQCGASIFFLFSKRIRMNIARNDKLPYFSGLRELLDMIKFERYSVDRPWPNIKSRLFTTFKDDFEKFEQC
jgi:hypothetical protein